MAVFRLKVYYSRRKSATKFLCVKAVSDKVVTVTVTVTVIEALVLRPLLEDRGRITESIRILVPIDSYKSSVGPIYPCKNGLWKTSPST